MLASVKISGVCVPSVLLRSHADVKHSYMYKQAFSEVMLLRFLAYLQRTTTSFQYRQLRMTLRFGDARDAQKAKVCSCTSNDHRSSLILCYIVESWELKAKLESLNVFNRHQDGEVTSVNWEDQDAATCLT